MAEGAVGAAKGEVVREGGDADGKVGGYVAGAAFEGGVVGGDVVGFRGVGPKVAQVGACAVYEGEAWEPARVEACGANDCVYAVGVPFVVKEARRGDGVDGFGEDCCVGGYEGLEVAWGGSRAAAAWVEGLGDDFVAEARVIFEGAGHLLMAEFSCCCGLSRAFDYEAEALVEFVFDLFAVFEVFLWVFSEELELFICVGEVGTVLACPRLGEAGCDPDWTADPVVKVFHFGLNICDYLDATTASTNYSDTFAFDGIA